MINITAELNTLYHIAIEKEDYKLALRVLQTLQKQPPELPSLSSLSDEMLQHFVDTWSAEVMEPPAPDPTDKASVEPNVEPTLEQNIQPIAQSGVRPITECVTESYVANTHIGHDSGALPSPIFNNHPALPSPIFNNHPAYYCRGSPCC